MDFLEEIRGIKRVELEEKKRSVPLNGIERLIDKCNPLFGFSSSLSSTKTPVRIIAEIKKASPSAGEISREFRPLDIARSYEKGGAAAISVLTEEKYFQGSLNTMHLVAKGITLPILRKDFIIDEYQVYESRSYRADAILLIAALLSLQELERFRLTGERMGMDSIVEVHNKDELNKALHSGAKIIGINNRNLKTLEVDLKTTEELVPCIPKDKIIVSESGIKGINDIKRLKNSGVRCFLIGELLMRADNRGSLLNELTQIA